MPVLNLKQAVFLTIQQKEILNIAFTIKIKINLFH